MVLSRLYSIKSHTFFEAVIYKFSLQESGKKTPFFSGHRIPLYLRTIGVSRVVELPKKGAKVMAEDNIKMKVKLTVSIAMEKGLRFTIRVGGRTVGSGVI